MRPFKAMTSVLLFAIAITFAATAVAQEQCKDCPADNATQVKPVDTRADTTPAPGVEAKRLSRKQKRELGILPRQVLSKARELAKAGDITQDMTKREMAFVYAAEVASSAEYGGAWNQVSDGTYGADWDAIIDFLERLFELLVKFLPMFL